MIKIENVGVKGLNNTRDLSSLSKLSGIKIKNNVVFRSGRLDKAKEKTRNNFLKNHNIKTIIDLRNDVEVSESHQIDYPDDVKVVHIPILNKEFFGITHEKKMSKALMKDCTKKRSIVKDDKYLVKMYTDILFDQYSQEKFRLFFKELLATKDGAVLYHCQTGKDRTGIVTMFILHILGISEDIILEDYMVSQYFNRVYVKSRKFLLTIGFFIKKDLRKLLKQMLGAKKSYLEQTIEALVARFGSLDNYIKDILLLNNNDISALRERLLY